MSAPAKRQPAAPINDKEPDLVAGMMRMLKAISPDIDTQVLKIVEANLREEFGGRVSYVKSTRVAELEAKAELARRLFNGRNPRELARQLGVGRATVYRWVKKTP